MTKTEQIDCVEKATTSQDPCNIYSRCAGLLVDLSDSIIV